MEPQGAASQLWNLYNGRHRKGEHIRVFPLSNWTEYDIWSYIGAEDIPLPAIYFSIAGRCSAATECCWRFTNTCSRRPVKTSSRRTSDSGPSAT